MPKRARNAPTFMVRSSTRDARNAEYVGTPFTDVYGDGTAHSYLGCNAAGANIGQGLTFNDKNLSHYDGFAEGQYLSQYIGGNGLGAGDRSTSSVIAMMPDYTYEASWVQYATADTDAPNFGDEFDSVNATLNFGSDGAGVFPILIGDLAFGTDWVG